MSHIKDRLSDYHDFMKKLVDDHQMVLASDVLEMIEQLKDDLEQDEKENGWIPAKEKPTEYGQYLVTFKKNTKVYIAEYGICQMPVTVLGQPIGCGWYSSTGYYYAEDSIVAWRPLPEPYKENEKHEID